MTTVLVLDDRPADRDLTATVLRYGGFDVLEAANGVQGLELARHHRPDLIVADLLMPGMNGYEFTRELRADPDPAIGRTPVIFSTATYEQDDVRRLAAACGVSHVLVKPCEPEAMIGMVGEVLGSTPTLMPLATNEQFDREQLRVLNEKLVEKVNEVEAINLEQLELQEDLRRAQRETAESLTLLETLQSTAPIGFGFVDCDLVCRQSNDTLAAIAGRPADELIGRTAADALPTLWRQLSAAYRRVLETGEALVNLKTTGESAATPGRVRHWLTSVYPVSIKRELIGVGLILIDVTEREQDAELRSVVMENLAEGLLVLDGEGRLVLMNPSASKMLGWTEDELRGEHVHPRIHHHRLDGSAIDEDDSQLLKVRTGGRTVRMADDAFTRKDGTIIPVSYSAAPLLSDATVRGIVVAFRDTTEERRDATRAQRELDLLTWVGRTRDALDEGRLVLYAQPIFTLDGAHHGDELLVRMVGRNGEIILPGAFLPAAEKYGLISMIDEWVIGEAVALAAAGRRVEANLSASSIGNLDLLALIERQLQEAGADPSKLVFEITETALMRDIEKGEAFANGLSEIGCGLALDDFGTGFGSFTYLKRLAIQYLKIDIEFVRDLSSSTANQHLVRSIVNLAQGFGHQTIAEGVEDARTLALLGEYGVDFAQGFHLGRPAPIEP